MRAFLLAFGGKLMRTHEGVSLNRSVQAGGERRLRGTSKQTRSAERKRSQSSAPASQDKVLVIIRLSAIKSRMLKC